eukprot:TRINITY_DN27466_c0_g1_i1.p1 TRINITY_DN27466_c0_g1~~TRINITY_DN27466_c0_g1_i1.p1  ORF type:complete len:180 (-),score=36.55 TRINITY_DN27466_c0_g1_i1:29-568(-)
MGRTKTPELQIQVLALCLLKQKLKNEKVNIAKISANKLARIGDPQTKLRKAVLINNVLKNVERQTDYGFECREAENLLQKNIEGLKSRDAFPIYKKGSNESFNSEKEDTDFNQNKLSLCDDIINEFLDIREDISKEKEIYEDKLCDTKVPPLHHFGCDQASPYSYSSFLSEVHSVQKTC